MVSTLPLAIPKHCSSALTIHVIILLKAVLNNIIQMICHVFGAHILVRFCAMKLTIFMCTNFTILCRPPIT